RQSERIPDIDTFIERLKATARQWPMTVGWIDGRARGASLGRGVLLCGRWAEPDEAPREFPTLHSSVPIPFDIPAGVLNPTVVRPFNTAYYHCFSARLKQSV